MSNEPRATTVVATPPPDQRAPADPAWSLIYRIGGAAALLYIVFALVVPAIMFIPAQYERGWDGHSLLAFIADHRTWWIVLQTLVLGVASILAPIAFTASASPTRPSPASRARSHSTVTSTSKPATC